MEENDTKTHWESIYKIRGGESGSWFQSIPGPSLELIRALDLPADAKIIDVGGGDSMLVDHLLGMGFKDLSVLDISEHALERARMRVGGRASEVSWIASDITTFRPKGKVDVWHDRATFHFLTHDQDVSRYLDVLQQSMNPGGYVILGTFSKDGPDRCSGLPVRQYTADDLKELVGPSFREIRCFQIDHQTPGGTIQNFLFCLFQRLGDGSVTGD